MLRKLERNDEHGGQAKVTNEDVLVRFILASQSPEIATLSRFIGAPCVYENTVFVKGKDALVGILSS